MGLLCCVIIIWWWMYRMCQMGVEEMAVMITFMSGCCWLPAAFFFSECCSAVISTPAYSGVIPFLSLLFSLSLSFLNWLVECQEPNFNPLATIPHILPHATVLFVFASSYETEVIRAFNVTSFSFRLKFGENSCFRQCNWDFSLIETRNASKTFIWRSHGKDRFGDLDMDRKWH